MSIPFSLDKAMIFPNNPRRTRKARGGFVSPGVAVSCTAATTPSVNAKSLFGNVQFIEHYLVDSGLITLSMLTVQNYWGSKLKCYLNWFRFATECVQMVVVKYGDFQRCSKSLPAHLIFFGFLCPKDAKWHHVTKSTPSARLFVCLSICVSVCILSQGYYNSVLSCERLVQLHTLNTGSLARYFLSQNSVPLGNKLDQNRGWPLVIVLTTGYFHIGFQCSLSIEIL